MFTLLFRSLHKVEALATGLNASRGHPADAEGGGRGETVGTGAGTPAGRGLSSGGCHCD